MENVPQTLTIEPSTWEPCAIHWIAKATGARGILHVQHQIESGAAQLFAIKQGAQTVGAFVLRVDDTATGAEGVIVAGAAYVQGVDMMASVVPHIEAMFQNVASIRFHTEKPAVARKMARLGYGAVEMVCRKELKK